MSYEPGAGAPIGSETVGVGATSRLLWDALGKLESDPVLENGVVSPLFTAADFRIDAAVVCDVSGWLEYCVDDADDDDDISTMTRRREAGESV